MTEKRTIFCLALAATLFTGIQPTTAQENTVFLKCAGSGQTFTWTINFANNTVTTDYGVWPATISATAIHFQIEANSGGNFPAWQEYYINRITGTLSLTTVINGKTNLGSEHRYHCTARSSPPLTKF